MAFCSNCGKEIDQKAVICPHCGVGQTSAVVDNGGFGYGLLGCCVPLAGLILFLVWKDTKPKSAKAAGIGALVYLVSLVLIYVLIFALGFADALMYY